MNLTLLTCRFTASSEAVDSVGAESRLFPSFTETHKESRDTALTAGPATAMMCASAEMFGGGCGGNV